MEYQVMAQNWMMTNMRARTFFFHQNAEQRVRTKAANMTTVAITLVLANMLVSCFMGPIRNKVLQKKNTSAVSKLICPPSNRHCIPYSIEDCEQLQVSTQRTKSQDQRAKH